jgi:hypothetical protein
MEVQIERKQNKSKQSKRRHSLSAITAQQFIDLILQSFVSLPM